MKCGTWCGSIRIKTPALSWIWRLPNKKSWRIQTPSDSDSGSVLAECQRLENAKIIALLGISLLQLMFMCQATTIYNHCVAHRMFPQCMGKTFSETWRLRQGFWKNHLRDRHFYHISALFVVDLVVPCHWRQSCFCLTLGLGQFGAYLWKTAFKSFNCDARSGEFGHDS